MADDKPNVFDLFSDGNPPSPRTPAPWYPGAKVKPEDYGQPLLRILPCGKANAIDAEILADRLNLPWTQTEYPLRNLIRQLVLEKGWPIGSTVLGRRRGFYMIDSDRDAEAYARTLQRQADSILKKQATLLKGWARRKRTREEGHEWPLKR